MLNCESEPLTMTKMESLAFVGALSVQLPRSAFNQRGKTQNASRSIRDWTSSSSSSSVRLHMSSHPEANDDLVNRRELLQSFGVVASTLVLGSVSLPEPASAERDLMGAKRSYFRYVPRVEQGLDMYVQTIYPAVEAADWSSLLKSWEIKSDARVGSKKAEYGIDRKVDDVQRFLLDPLNIWAQSFAEKGAGPVYKYLETCVRKLEVQMDRLEKIANGKDLKFSKENEGLSRAEAAKDAWVKGKVAINDFIAKADTVLSRELRKLDLIPDDLSTYESHSKRPTPYGTFQ
mmetsp:Transcript_10508/g.18054  ORF Transcript_10508/g.18054 Transcript_10508/m.18054 type:complete len:289 (+) Transcript_10508:88-954(+)